MTLNRNCNKAALAWVAFGGLIALGVGAMFVRELPAMRREINLLRM